MTEDSNTVPMQGHYDIGEKTIGMNDVARDLLKIVPSSEKAVTTTIDSVMSKRKSASGMKKAWETRRKKAQAESNTAHKLFVDMLRGYLTYLEAKGSWSSVTTSEADDEVTIVVKMVKAGK